MPSAIHMVGIRLTANTIKLGQNIPNNICCLYYQIKSTQNKINSHQG